MVEMTRRTAKHDRIIVIRSVGCACTATNYVEIEEETDVEGDVICWNCQEAIGAEGIDGPTKDAYFGIRPSTFAELDSRIIEGPSE